ncbi:SNARE complex subunit (Syn8) [Blumeria hordei DH14]|uniref:SNARE complex subunit (Syn8) n=1 Tax=Blumeria graminis f. sp. hordei (strain DH14) TaxID=546991 RepID=N1JJ25_BLUG1|nr:SNARE complex subunit (Syn8) [Blumeria hordei DH14]
MAYLNQYCLLADHIKLSLLERRRAASLNLVATSQDSHISCSLDALREGLAKISQEATRLMDAGDINAAHNHQEIVKGLQAKYDDLTAQFHGNEASQLTTLASPPSNTKSSIDTSQHSSESKHNGTISSSLKGSLRHNPLAANLPKSVRFSDADLVAEAYPSYAYRDDPASPDASHMDNQQIHAHHTRVLAQQDETLHRLGQSIGRQRELSIQIGEELDEHAQMLDHVDRHVDRHQTRLNQSMKSLGKVARSARNNMQLTIIVVLIAILALLIVFLN